MKRKLLVLVSLLMIFCLLPLEGLAVRWGTVVRVTARSAVDVRKGPGSDYGRLGEVQPENTYPLLGEKNGWYYIVYTGDKTGYVPSKYTTPEHGLVPDYLGSGDYVDAVVRVTHYNALNVRSGPGKKYSTIGSAKPDSTWTFLGTDDGWNIIQYSPSQIGYIAANRTEVEVVDAWSGPSDVVYADCDVCNNTRICPTCKGEQVVYSAVARDEVDCPTCAGLGVCYACYSNE